MAEERAGTFSDLKAEVSGRRKKILVESAKKVMLRSGVRATTLRQIAGEANVTTGALYHHFRNQHHIWAAVYVDSVEAIIALFDGVETDAALKTNEERIRELARRYLTHLLDNGWLIDIRASIFFEKDFDEDARRLMDEANERLLERFMRIAVSSRFTEVAFTQRLAEVLWALLNGLLVTHRRSNEGNAKVLELADQAFDLWFSIGKSGGGVMPAGAATGSSPGS
jgi:AcrR family transcriptional regulator